MEAEPSRQEHIEALVDEMYLRSDKLIYDILCKFVANRSNENPEPVIQ